LRKKMKSVDHLQTMAFTYQEICQGERPWTALGNFMNDWFGYAVDRREELAASPIMLPANPTEDQLRWAAFCAASVEYLCEKYGLACPSWVHASIYRLPTPWFDSPGAHKPQIRARLQQQTPEPFTRRNIFCGNRIFANKYELAEQHRRRAQRL
jgi:hypothetical protein